MQLLQFRVSPANYFRFSGTKIVPYCFLTKLSVDSVDQTKFQTFVELTYLTKENSECKLYVEVFAASHPSPSHYRLKELGSKVNKYVSVVMERGEAEIIDFSSKLL